MARSRVELFQRSSFMALLATWLLAAVAMATSPGNVAAEVRDSQEAEQGLIEGDPGDGTCVTTVTASTTIFTSLMQAVSARTRLKEGVAVSQVEKPEQVLVHGHAPADFKEVYLPEQPAQHNASRAAASPGHGGEVLTQESSSPCFLHSSMAVATSLLQQGRALGVSALDRLRAVPFVSLHERSTVAASTGALILIFCLLAVLGVSAFLAMISLANTTEPHLPPELLARTNSPYGSRLYLPMTASPAPSLRSTRASPEVSHKRLLVPSPEVTRLPTSSRIPLAKAAQDLASSDEEQAPRKTLASELHFCPDLVVPPHCECILVLPVDVGTTRTSFTIMDVHGNPVLKAVPGSTPTGTWQATVTTSGGEKLVTCVDTRPFGNEVEFHLNRANGQTFAKLTHSPTEDKYFLTLQSGTVLSIFGTFMNSEHVNFTDDGNRLLATTEIGSADFDPDGTYIRLRVAPLSDVGLALCGLLCIGQHLQRKT